MRAKREGVTATPERERLQRQYRELLGEYKTVNAELADVSWTLAELEQQIAALDGEALADDRFVERRRRDLQRWRGALEEQALGYMYRAEALEAAIARLRGELDTPSATR